MTPSAIYKFEEGKNDSAVIMYHYMKAMLEYIPISEIFSMIDSTIIEEEINYNLRRNKHGPNNETDSGNGNNEYKESSVS